MASEKVERDEVSFEITEHIGILANNPSGWTKEINMVSWNNTPAKYDIRDWDEDHEHMSRGVTLKEEELDKLLELIQNRKA